MSTGVLTGYGTQILASSLFTQGVSMPSMWVALFLYPPDGSDDADGLQEVPQEVSDPVTLAITSTGYVRGAAPTVVGGESLWVQRRPGLMVYLNEVRFPEALIDWGFITSWGLMDSDAGGRLIAYGSAGFDVNGPDDPVDDEDFPTGDVVVVGAESMSLDVLNA